MPHNQIKSNIFESGSEAHIQVKEIKHRETQTHSNKSTQQETGYNPIVLKYCTTALTLLDHCIQNDHL